MCDQPTWNPNSLGQDNEVRPKMSIPSSVHLLHRSWLCCLQLQQRLSLILVCSSQLSLLLQFTQRSIQSRNREALSHCLDCPRPRVALPVSSAVTGYRGSRCGWEVRQLYSWSLSFLLDNCLCLKTLGTGYMPTPLCLGNHHLPSPMRGLANSR